MRIALIGAFGDRLDEGMRKLCAQYAEMAGAQHDVLTFGTREFASGLAWRRLWRYRPDCLHYLTGPTWRSLVALRAHQIGLPRRAVTIVSGVRPYLGAVTRRLVRWARPDIYLGQARRWTEVFAAAGSHIEDFPNWTNLSRFHPAKPEAKKALQKQFGLPNDRRLVLHVGHVKPNRNLTALLDAQRSGRYQVWVIGSQSESRPGPWWRELETAGVLVDSRFYPRIEEVYQAADFYAFTVRATPKGEFPCSYNEVGVIDLPLSVLEARGCGLPVLSTRHDALQHFLKDDPAMHWFDGTGGDCLSKLDMLQQKLATLDPLADSFDQRHVSKRLRAIYALAESIRS